MKLFLTDFFQMEFDVLPEDSRTVLSWKHTRVRLRLRSRPRLRLRFGDKTHWVRHDLPVM